MRSGAAAQNGPVDPSRAGELGEGRLARSQRWRSRRSGRTGSTFSSCLKSLPGSLSRDLGPGEDSCTGRTGGSSRRASAASQRELASSRAHLESVIIEQEAANEEIVASNEELQSLNEELESSKEELEATNEELTTVNQELQVRNAELDNAREFAQATIDTVRSSLVVLGPDLRVLKANQSFYRTSALSPAEVEHRFIYELGGGHWSFPGFGFCSRKFFPRTNVMEDFEMEYESGPWGGGRF